MSTSDDSGNQSDAHECPTCGETFGSTQWVSRHHNNEHGETLSEYRRRQGDYDCPSCDAAFDSRASLRGHHVHAHDESIAVTTVSCAACGDDVLKRKCHIKDNERSFCGPDCADEWKSEHWVGENHHNYGGRIEAQCTYCGDVVEKRPSEINRYESAFCDQECYHNYIVGENSPLWKGGYHYSSEWRSIRGEILERDDYRCQDCGMSNERHKATFGQQLTVHHIQPILSFDDPAEADTPDNLITLCAECHPVWEKFAPLRPQLVD